MNHAAQFAPSVIETAPTPPPPGEESLDEKAETAKQLDARLHSLAALDTELAAVIKNVRIEVTPEGILIEAVDQEGGLLFDLSSAKLNEPLERFLHALGPTLALLNRTDRDQRPHRRPAVLRRREAVELGPVVPAGVEGARDPRAEQRAEQHGLGRVRARRIAAVRARRPARGAEPPPVDPHQDRQDWRRQARRGRCNRRQTLTRRTARRLRCGGSCAPSSFRCRSCCCARVSVRTRYGMRRYGWATASRWAAAAG